MKSIQIFEHGSPSVLTIADILEGTGDESQVSVKISHAALNWLDIAIRKGISGPGLRLPQKLPHVMGADGSGTVVHVGKDANTDLQVGEPVVIYPGLSCGTCARCRSGDTTMCGHYRLMGEDVDGLQVERLWVDPSMLVRAPTHLTMAEAATVPIAFTTAWNLLERSHAFGQESTVLVLGAAGGVAQAAISLAVASGAKVIAGTRRRGDAELGLTAMGAEIVIDTSNPDWLSELAHFTKGRGVNVVVDPVGAATWRHSVNALATGGRLATCGAASGDLPEISIREIYQYHRSIIGAPMGGIRQFHAATRMVSTTRLKPKVDSIYSFGSVQRAHRRLASSERFGRIVLAVD